MQKGGEAERGSGQQCVQSLVNVMNALHLRKHVSGYNYFKVAVAVGVK